MRPESLSSLEHKVTCYESTEEGNNICLCLSFSMEVLS